MRFLTALCMTVVVIAGGIENASSSGRASPRPRPASEAAAYRFVTRHWIHGVPYEPAHDLGPTVVPFLSDMLQDERQKDNWATITSTIAFIGSPESFGILHDFIWARFRGEIDLPTFQAIGAAQAGMGHLAASDTTRVLRYLIQSSDPAYWNGIPWTCGERTLPQLGTLFSKLSIMALAFTGSSEALRALQNLREKPYSPDLSPTIELSISRFQQVMVKGLSEYEHHREESHK